MPKNANMLGDRWSVHYGDVCEIRYHFVWCPKYRRPVFQGGIANRLKELLQECVTSLGGEILDVAIQPDHIHLFVQMRTPYLSPTQIAFRLKGYTSRVLRREFAELRRRLPTLWSRSYYMGTKETIERYIALQKGR